MIRHSPRSSWRHLAPPTALLPHPTDVVDAVRLAGSPIRIHAPPSPQRGAAPEMPHLIEPGPLPVPTQTGRHCARCPAGRPRADRSSILLHQYALYDNHIRRADTRIDDTVRPPHYRARRDRTGAGRPRRRPPGRQARDRGRPRHPAAGGACDTGDRSRRHRPTAGPPLRLRGRARGRLRRRRVSRHRRRVCRSPNCVGTGRPV